MSARAWWFGIVLSAVLWVVLGALLMLIFAGCAAPAKPGAYPFSKLAGANPNCFRNCTANYLTADNAAAPVTVTGTRTNTETVNQP